MIPQIHKLHERWFLQEHDWGLGDFILATPMLQVLSEVSDDLVRVFFDTPYIAEAYKDCPFIKVLRQRPSTEPFGDNKYQRSLLRLPEDSEDIAHLKSVLGRVPLPVPHTYIDSCGSSSSAHKCAAVFFGCHHPRFYEAKRVPSALIKKALYLLSEQGYAPILLGTASDQELYWKEALSDLPCAVENYLGKLSLRETLALLNQCQYFVSNDTGLYHAAVALKKRGTVIWGDTKLNNSPLYRPYVNNVHRNFHFQLH